MNEPHDPNVTSEIPAVPDESRLSTDPLFTTDHARGSASTDRPHPGADAPGDDMPSVPGYRVLREIARGGMGKVLAAFDLTLDRDVALKILLPGARADRFVRESKITARLPHPGIPPVHALGTLPDGSPFLAMKLIVGTTLAEELKMADRPRLLQVFTQVCQAVGFAHSRGVIHRDLKPANIMVGAFGEVQVMDWGLAKELGGPEVADQSGSSEVRRTHSIGTDPAQTTDYGKAGESTDDRTLAGSVMGTPAYMAPEQARGEAVDARADVFALGGILCAILTGAPPFTGNSSLEVIRNSSTGDLAVAFVRLERCGADAELLALCRRCLNTNPKDRPADGQAVADGITAYLNGVQERLHQAELAEAEAKTKAAEQRKRRRVVAAAATVVVIILVVGSVAAVQMRNAARAAGLVASLASADVAQVPQILAELENHRGRVTPMLVALAGAEANTMEERKTQLHARLALVTHDEQQVQPLVEELLAANVLYFGVIRDQLAPYHQRFAGDLWELLHNTTADPARRFRAGLALATYATISSQWTAADNTYLVGQLVEANPEHQQRLRQFLRPLDSRLLGDLEGIFGDSKVTESHQLSAVNALVDFAAKDTLRLARLLSSATPGQYEILYPLLAEARDNRARESLSQLVRSTPAADLPQIERVSLGQRRAGAAITLLRQGERESILDVLRVEDDLESLTQFVHRCRQRGILPVQLLECLKLADLLRQPKVGEARRIEDRVVFGLLLALGEFDLADLSEAERSASVAQLAAWYANDPSSTIHGATGWLLRHWKQDELVRKVDHTFVPYVPEREWYTLKFVTPPLDAAHNGDENSTPIPMPRESRTTFCVTFVVFPAGEYLIGSAPDEAFRLGHEQRHAVKLTRPIAVSDREITWEQFNPFDNRDCHDAWEKQFGRTLTAEEPVFGVSWYEAVAYCRWLTKSAGMSEDDQAYADPASLDRARFPAEPDPAARGVPRNWPLDLDKRGIRLPTEAEWEMVSRGGTKTAYSFGNDMQLLEHYGWFQENSAKWSHAVGRLRPTVRGLFDIHGNVNEFCHGWYGDYDDEAGAEDPTGPAEGSGRVFRGGGWSFNATDCRLAFRSMFGPSHRSNGGGFRLALSLPWVSQEAVPVKGAEPSGGGTERAKR